MLRHRVGSLFGMVCALLTAFIGRAAEATWEYSVRVSAAVTKAPAAITLTWPQDQFGTPSSYTVYRKTPEASSWGPGVTLPGSATSYVDTAVATTAVYEYQIQKVASGYTGYGYIAVGLETPIVDNRGKVLLLVDATHASPLSAEITRLQQDLIGDGWLVLRADISRTETPANVRNYIRTVYQAEPSLKAVFLLGRIPVPYSGNMVPDGHAPDHQGAWPADAFYGDMDGNWTDTSVNTTVATEARNHNVPGDGKLDQSFLPSALELQVGRVDLSKMPGRKFWGGPATFPSEQELLRNYLNKDHQYRHRQFNLPRRAVVHDGFGSRGGEAFAASGYRAFAALLGPNNVQVVEPGQWVAALKTSPALWGYGCGAGSYSSIGGLGTTGVYLDGTTIDLVEADVKSVFVMVMGSWLGDWDTEDNIMRSVLATSSYGLASAWSGRPHWFFHHMGAGQTIGHSARVTQNNGSSGLYKNQINSVAGGTHVALMGDPTLRLHPVAPPSGLLGIAGAGTATLNWTASADTVVGYHVYRATTAAGPFIRLTFNPITAQSYTDTAMPGASAAYMIRAVKLESTSSGTYYNLSQGAFVTLASALAASPQPSTDGTTSPLAPTSNSPVVSTSPTPATTTSTVWVDDALPNGAVPGATGGDSWNWISSTPLPFSGRTAHISSLAGVMHQHFFEWANPGLSVSPGDWLYTYVYLDPAYPPREIMLQWKAGGTWDQRAYWGGDHIPYGTEGTPSRKRIGNLPAVGQWVRLELPASAVGLEGKTVDGMAFTVSDGRVVWDASGKSSGGPQAPPVDNTPPVVSLVSPIGGQTVSGTVNLAATATDNVAVAGVQFQLNGINLGAEDTTVPYSFAWNTWAAANTTAQLSAIARDSGGNRQTSAVVSLTVNNTAVNTNVGPSTNLVMWFDDALPAGAVGRGDGGDSWSWQGANPAPAVGRLAHEAATASGLHQHYFEWASTPLAVSTGDWLFTYVYLDPAAPPRQIMLQWKEQGGWEHRAYWGANLMNFGTDGTAGRRRIGALPALGQWVRLDVRASDVGLEGKIIDGMAFSTFDGRAVWDASGKTIGGASQQPAPTDTIAPVVRLTGPANNSTVQGTVTVSATATDNTGVAGVQFKLNGNNLGFEDTTYPYSVSWNTVAQVKGSYQLTAVARDAAGNQQIASVVTVLVDNGSSSNSVVWVDDGVPAGAVPGGDGGDTWNWVSANPAPFSGKLAHQSSLAGGLHQHYFAWASKALTIGAGDWLYAYVYIDPANPPQEIMLQWKGQNWEHRAYWGADLIDYGLKGTAARKYVGPLPAAGRWILLEVPARAVGLEGETLTGMAFSLFDGRATWDAAGKSAGSTLVPVPVSPTISVSATATNAVEGGTGFSEFTFVRSGDSSLPLSIGYTLSGTATSGVDYRRAEGDVSVTISLPAGALSASLRFYAVDDTEVESLENIVLTLNPNPSFIVGVPASATTLVADNDSSSGSTNNPPVTNIPPVQVSTLDYTTLQMPKVGEHGLNVLSPTILELQLLNLKQPDPGGVNMWDWVDASGQFKTPAITEFAVTVNGQPAQVKSVGFKRRAFYAPIMKRDLRLLNNLYLELTTSVPDNATVEVKNLSGALWPATMQFTARTAPLRYSPAIHVNQEGYVPAFTKKAMVGYYLGNLGEMNVAAGTVFKLLDTQSGNVMHQGTLTLRKDVGFNYSPMPYQKVLEADFTAFKTPGEYRLLVPGLGASLPFVIHEGVAMAFARTYALGLYHQRCGTNNALPFTRHTHDNCHLAAADVPLPASSYNFTWNCVAQKSADFASNPRHTAPQLKDVGSQLYPILRTGKIDVSGGHHDAGDYSRYTINAAGLAHYLMFSVDSLPGVADLDNLGLPNSGDGVSDLLQETKWETDYISKLQDSDGGFFFLVYPREREYEWGVTPDRGDPQVVWPKNTAATAAAVAALAQAASSPRFKAAYPETAARYLQQARLGWQFLMDAIALHGQDGAYQKITHYGNEFMHDDELAWAACEMFLATGEPAFHHQLKAWYNPSDPATLRWGWWRLYEAWGAAARSYAFAARSGRLPISLLDPVYLAKCEEQVRLCAQDQARWSRNTSYGSSFPLESKSYRAAGWFFSSERAFDVAVGYQLDPRAEFTDAIVANMDYEGGCNPVNVSFITGLGWKRQREVVHQYAVADLRVLPPSGIPQGNISSSFMYTEPYKGELEATVYPSDNASTAPYPFYDRWSDAYNVSTEFVHLDQGRSLGSLAFLATLTTAKSQSWASANPSISVSNKIALGVPATVTVTVPGMSLDGARVVWEARDHEPAYGPSFVLTPINNGIYWIEAEIQWPDGRRVCATTTTYADGPSLTWIDDDLPPGSDTGAEGGDGWNWVTANPTPQSGNYAHQTSDGTGLRQHFFFGASSTMAVNVGDKMFAYVYLDPATPPTEIMLQWNANGWDHRAYWGANQINLGSDATASRRSMGALPALGRWVRLEVPARLVGLEGKVVSGMAFSAFGGKVTWDAAGRTAQ